MGLTPDDIPMSLLEDESANAEGAERLSAAASADAEVAVFLLFSDPPVVLPTALVVYY